ncbi:MAG TPA: hypothetical protein DCW50_09495 [Gammaproteobacteria bacterium]|nr:MAG: amidophosphoribosyltransferase [Candidatus Thioglobus sp. MED-G23]HAU42268.1 hypothetical protein [Gammaproteobacteria bacterium]
MAHPFFSGTQIPPLNWENFIRMAGRAALQWITPPCCLLCYDQPESRSGLCRDCWQKLPFIRDPQCLSCARALTHPGICGQCQQRPPVYDSAIAPLAYDNPVNEMLCALKYRQHLSFARPIAGVMVDAVVTQRQKRPDMLCAVPMTSRALRKRGLNQSIFIARFVSRGLGIPLCAALIKKIRHTDQQSALSAKNRQSNLDNAFACRRRLDGRHVALIDDILTTGATANEISKILKAAGAVRVDLWACARTARSSR